MVLLDYLIVELIKAGAKAYKKSQQNQAASQTSGGVGGRPQRRVRRGQAPQTIAQQSARQAAADKALVQAAEKLEEFARGFARDTAEEDQALQALGRVAGEVIVPAARKDGRNAARGGQGDPHWHAGIQGRLRFHQRMLGGLEQMAAQRRDPQRATMLHAVDVVALSCYRPLLAFQERRGIPLSTSRPVAIFGEAPGSLTPLFARTPVAPVEVSVRLQHDVAGWPTIAREVGRDIVISLDGYREDLRVAAEFPPPRAALPGGGLTEDVVRDALGVWQVELCADIIAAIMLGPAYLAALTMLHGSPDQPFKTRVVQVTDGHIDPRPPAELLVVAVGEALHRIGMTEQADEILDAWLSAHDADMEFYFPTGGGRYAALPEDFYAEPVRKLARVVCGQQVKSLAGMHLLDVPGFHFSLARHKEAELALDVARTGRIPRGDARTAVAAAAMLGYLEPSQRVPALELLRGALAPEAETLSRSVARRVTGGREDPLAPQVIRDAIIMYELLEPRFKGGRA